MPVCGNTVSLLKHYRYYFRFFFLVQFPNQDKINEKIIKVFWFENVSNQRGSAISSLNYGKGHVEEIRRFF